MEDIISLVDHLIFVSFCVLVIAGKFVIFKPLSYCFEEATGFDVKTSFTTCPVSRLIKPRGITKEFQIKANQFHGTFHGLKTKN